MPIDASNRRTLKIAFVLSTVFALSQLAAAAVSRSLALLGDCILMLLDSASYVVNWRAEVPGITPHRAAAERVRAASISVAVLVGTTIFIIVEAAGRLREDADAVRQTALEVSRVVAVQQASPSTQAKADARADTP